MASSEGDTTKMMDAHRMFLQAFMCQGIMSAQEVRQHFKMCQEQCPMPDDQSAESNIAVFVDVINLNLKPMSLEIRKAVSEDTGKHFYGLVNLTKSDVTLHSSDYSAVELENFKRIVEEIVESDSGSISSISVFNMTDTVPGKSITKKDIEKMLAKMKRDKWLVESDRGEISLSTRSLLELDQYIQQQFPDSYSKCYMCQRICIKGDWCGGATCDLKAHYHCADKLFPGASRKCPRCATEWPESTRPVARKGAVTDESDGAPPSTRRRRGVDHRIEAD